MSECKPLGLRYNSLGKPKGLHSVFFSATLRPCVKNFNAEAQSRDEIEFVVVYNLLYYILAKTDIFPPVNFQGMTVESKAIGFEQWTKPTALDSVSPNYLQVEIYCIIQTLNPYLNMEA